MSYALSILPVIAVSLLLAASCFLVLRMGEISFGQQAFFAVGAYATAILTAVLGWHIAPALAAAALVAGLAAWLAGFAALRLTGFQFSLFTLVLAEFLREALTRWTWRLDVDGRETGPEGALGFPALDYFLDNGYGPGAQAALALGIAAAAMLVLRSLDRGPRGRALEAVATDRGLAEAAGIDTRRLRHEAFAAAGATAGLGGGLFALTNTYIDPSNFSLMLGVHALAYTLLGGLGSIWGPLAGTVVDIVFLEALRLFGGYRMVIFGSLLVVALILRPQGLLGARKPSLDQGVRP